MTPLRAIDPWEPEPRTPARSLPVAPDRQVCGSTLCPISRDVCPGHCVFADVLSSVQVGIVLFHGAERRLIFVNAQAREILERHQCVIDYQSLHALFVPPGIDLASFESPFPAEPLALDQRLIGYTLYRANDYAWIFLRDVTEKVRLESIAESVGLMNSLGFVFSAVRHELGNPINSVKAALTVLRQNVDRYGRDALEGYIDRMLAELGRVEHLLRGMKSFSMFERVEPRPVAVAACLRDLLALVEREAEGRGIAIATRCTPDAMVHADPRALGQVLLNLFANAADALEGIDDPRIEIDVTVSDGLARIRFADDGRGLTPTETQHLFKPFHTNKAKGTGLGLVISRKLVGKMQGTISLEPGASRGVVATITLPAVAG